MDLLFSPKVLARAVAPWLALLLAAAGIGSIAFEQFVAHPEAVRFSRQGRRVVGAVTESPAFIPTDSRDGRPRNRSLVAVNDEGLGPQAVSIYGVFPKGTTVPLLCLTSEHRCVSAGDNSDQLLSWPVTPIMITGAGEPGVAALLALTARRSRRLRAAHRPSAAPPAVSV